MRVFLALILQIVLLNSHFAQNCERNAITLSVTPSSLPNLTEDIKDGDSIAICESKIIFTIGKLRENDTAYFEISDKSFTEEFTFDEDTKVIDLQCLGICYRIESIIRLKRQTMPECTVKLVFTVVEDPWEEYEVDYTMRFCEDSVFTDIIKFDIQKFDTGLFRTIFNGIDSNKLQYRFKPNLSLGDTIFRLGIKSLDSVLVCANTFEKSFSYDPVSIDSLKEFFSTLEIDSAYCLNDSFSMKYEQSELIDVSWYLDGVQRQTNGDISFKIDKDRTELRIVIQDKDSNCEFDTTYTLKVRNDIDVQIMDFKDKACVGDSIELRLAENFSLSDYSWTWNEGDSNSLNKIIVIEEGMNHINLNFRHLISPCPDVDTLLIVEGGNIELELKDSIFVSCPRDTFIFEYFYNGNEDLDKLNVLINYNGNEYNVFDSLIFNESTLVSIMISDSDFGCSIEDSIRIEVPSFDFDITTSKLSACVGDSVIFNLKSYMSDTANLWTWNNIDTNQYNFSLEIYEGSNMVFFQYQDILSGCIYDTSITITGGSLDLESLYPSYELTVCKDTPLKLKDLYSDSGKFNSLSILLNGKLINFDTSFYFSLSDTALFEITDTLFGCKILDTFKIQVPQVEFELEGIDDKASCDSIELRLTPKLENSSDYRFSWELNDSIVSSNQFFSVTVYEDSRIRLVVTDSFDCQFSRVDTVEVISFDPGNIRIIDSCGPSLKLLAVSDKWQNIHWSFPGSATDYEIIPGFQRNQNVIGVIQYMEELPIRIEVIDQACSFIHDTTFTSVFSYRPVVLADVIRPINCDTSILFITSPTECDVIWYSIDPNQTENATFTRLEGGRLVPDSLRKSFSGNILFAACSSCDTIYGLTSRSDFVEDDCFNLEDINVELYPNPVTQTGVLNVKVVGVSGSIGEISIYTLMGEKVASRKFITDSTPFEFSTGNLGSGLFIVSVQINGLKSVHKIYIQ